MSELQRLKKWLSDECSAEEVYRCRLVFKTGLNNRGEHQTMEGCWYQQPAISQPGFYLLGGLPKSSYKRLGNSWHNDSRVISQERKCCYLIPQAPEPYARFEFYLSCYFIGFRDKEKSPYTRQVPFGPFSRLAPWTVSDKIDDDTGMTYERFDVDVEWIDEPAGKPAISGEQV
jgi:hypothetical protein